MTDSMASCVPRETCRLCGSRLLEAVFSLTPTPPANDFRPAERLAEPQPAFPLDVMLCADCHHLQLGHVVDPGSLFRDYVYVSGTSPSFVRHFEDYARSVWAASGAAAGDLVVDIGSNDGTLLRAFRTLGATVQGVDPAVRIAAAASADGVPTRAAFFDAAVAGAIRRDCGPARIVTANNVCAHVDDLAGLVEAVAGLLRPDGVFVFEVSYRLDVLEKTLFDTIYHEHLDYHAVAPLKGFLARHGLRLVDAERVASHGGSIRLTAVPTASARAEKPSVAVLVEAEAQAGLFRRETYLAYADRIAEAGSALRAVLDAARGVGRRIAGYGAPAKATTLMHHFHLTGADLQYIVDDSPWKQGLFSPGLNIPVVAASRLAEQPVDDLLILAWNFAEPIMQKNVAFLADGGRFIVPLPALRVVSGDGG